jgi:hypothetical protein
MFDVSINGIIWPNMNELLTVHAQRKLNMSAMQMQMRRPHPSQDTALQANAIAAARTLY